jgi:hypothetical protein
MHVGSYLLCCYVTAGEAASAPDEFKGSENPYSAAEDELRKWLCHCTHFCTPSG